MENKNAFDQYLTELRVTRRALVRRLADISCNDMSIRIQTESLLKFINSEISEYEAYEKF